MQLAQTASYEPFTPPPTSELADMLHAVPTVLTHSGAPVLGFVLAIVVATLTALIALQ